jgi:hypothetical protein
MDDFWINVKNKVTSEIVFIELLPGSCRPFSSSIGEVSPGVSAEACDGVSASFGDDIFELFMLQNLSQICHIFWLFVMIYKSFFKVQFSLLFQPSFVSINVIWFSLKNFVTSSLPSLTLSKFELIFFSLNKFVLFTFFGSSQQKKPTYWRFKDRGLKQAFRLVCAALGLIINKNTQTTLGVCILTFPSA